MCIACIYKLNTITHSEVHRDYTFEHRHTYRHTGILIESYKHMEQVVEYIDMLTYAQRCTYLPLTYVSIQVCGACVNRVMFIGT